MNIWKYFLLLFPNWMFVLNVLWLVSCNSPTRLLSWTVFSLSGRPKCLTVLCVTGFCSKQMRATPQFFDMDILFSLCQVIHVTVLLLWTQAHLASQAMSLKVRTENSEGPSLHVSLIGSREASLLKDVNVSPGAIFF